MRLVQYQHALSAYLLRGDRDAMSVVIGDARVNAQARLDIYRDAYGLRLHECLEKDFPALVRLLGADAFAALARDYIAAHPSRHYSVRYLGRELGTFLAQHAQYGRDPVYAELATFEWALLEAFDAADAAPIALAAVATLAPAQWPQMQFQFHPSLQSIHLRTPVPALWKVATAGNDAPLPATPASAPCLWLVWRRDLELYFRALDAAEAAAFTQARAGATFGALCEDLCTFHAPDHVAAAAAALLKQWLADGWIVGFTLSA